MIPWRHRDDRVRPGEARPLRRSKPAVEGLEGRMLLSTAKPAVSAAANPSNVPAAYKPPPSAKLLFPPYHISASVGSPTDEGGGNQVFQGNVEVDGIAFPESVLWLAQGFKPGYFLNITRANALGQYAFVVPVGKGTTPLRVFAESPTQDYSNIDVVTVQRGDPIEAWDALALHAIQVQGLPAAEAARDLAILHAAQYDAVAGITAPGSAYRAHLAAPGGASDRAAADSAADAVLTALFPTQTALFVAAEQSAIAGLPASPSTTSGVAYGQQVAAQDLADRSGDGAPVTPAGPVSLLGDDSATFARVTPFVLSSPSAFRPPAPPAVGSAAYDQALAQVSALGRVTSTTRTPDQAAAALFWNEGPDQGVATDPAHWNAIAEQFSMARGDSLLTDARLFAQLDFALADAGIAAADAQATYQEARPIAAIQPSDPTFFPLLTTPASPSYVSDHAAYAAAASQVLSATFGAHASFADAEPDTGLTRSFASFAAAATDDANSRVAGGVNFAFDAQAGLALGTQVGKAVLAGFPGGK